MTTDPTAPLIGETTDLHDLGSVVRSRWERRAAMVLGEIRAARTPDRQAVLWSELGRVQELRLGRNDLAARSYERSLALVPSASAAWGLARIAARARDWQACDGMLSRLTAMAVGEAGLREVRRMRDEIARAKGRRVEPSPARLALRPIGADDDEEESTAVADSAPPVSSEPLPEDALSAVARTRAAARATTDRRLSVAIQLRAATDLRLRGELGTASELVDDAARSAPVDDAVFDARARLARDRKDWAELARILLARADGPGGAAVATNARALAALALRVAVGTPSEAAVRLAEVPETDGDPWTLTRAATELAAGRGLAAAERLAAAAASARSARIAAILQLAAAEAARESGHHDVALARLADAARTLPNSGLLQRRIVAAHEAAEHWGSVVAVLDGTIETGEAGAWARAKAARVCVHRIGDRATAETLLRASLRQFPEGVGARLALEGILVAEGRVADLDALIAEPAPGDPDVRAWRRLWLRRAGRLEEPGEAVAQATHLAAQPEGTRARWVLQALLAEQGRWAGLAEALAAELAAGTGRRVSCLLQLVHVRARIDAVDDVAIALGSTTGPEDDGRLLGLVHERMCYASGQLGGLIDRWVQRLERAPDPATRARLALLCLLGVDPTARSRDDAAPSVERLAAARVAAICLDKLRDDPRGWIALRPLAHAAALELDDWSGINALVLDEIDSAQAGTSFWTLLTAAEIAERRLGDVPTAIAHLERAESQRRGHPAVLRMLLRLYRHAERWTSLESLLLGQARRPADTPALPWLARLAVTDLELRRDDARAASTCSAILRDHPAFAPALRGVERLLVPRGHFADLASTWAQAALAVEDESRVLALRASLDAATLASDDERPELDRRALLNEIVEADPADRGACLELADAMPSGQAHAAQRAKVLEACLRQVDAEPDRMLLLAQIAEEHVTSGDSLSAIPRAESASTARTDCHLGSLLGLANAFVARASTEAAAAVRLGSVLTAIAEECRRPENRRDALSFASRLFQADPARHEQALACVRGVLEIDPKNPDALTRLVSLRSDRGEWSQLVDELRTIVETDPDAPDTIVLLEQIAVIQRERLGALEQAAATCEIILARNPRHATAMLWRAQALEKRRAWAEAAQAFEDVLRVVSGPERVPPLRELAALYHDRVASPERGRQVLEELIRAEPDEIQHLWRLSDILFGDRKWEPAEQVGRKVVAREKDPDRRIDGLVRLAQIREHGFRDPHGAVEWYARALEVDPIRQATVDELASCLKRAGDLAGVAAYRRQFSGSLRERLHHEPTGIGWWRRFAESLAQRGLDLPCELASSMIDWLESRGAAGRVGHARVLSPDVTRSVLRAVGVPPWALGLLPRLESVLTDEYGWEPKKLGVKRSDRLTNEVGHPIRERVRGLADALGMGPIEIYVFPVADGLVRTPLAEKPTIVADPRLGEVAESIARFSVATGLLRLACGMRLPHVFAPDALVDILVAVTMSLDPAAAPLDRQLPDPQVVRKLGKAIPKTDRVDIARLCREAFMKKLEPAVLRVDVERGLAAAATAVCGSLAAGVETIAMGIPPRQYDRAAPALQLVIDVMSEEVMSVIDRAPMA